MRDKYLDPDYFYEFDSCKKFLVEYFKSNSGHAVTQHKLIQDTKHCNRWAWSTIIRELHRLEHDGAIQKEIIGDRRAASPYNIKYSCCPQTQPADPPTMKWELSTSISGIIQAGDYDTSTEIQYDDDSLKGIINRYERLLKEDAAALCDRDSQIEQLKSMYNEKAAALHDRDSQIEQLKSMYNEKAAELSRMTDGNSSMESRIIQLQDIIDDNVFDTGDLLSKISEKDSKIEQLEKELKKLSTDKDFVVCDHPDCEEPLKSSGARSSALFNDSEYSNVNLFDMLEELYKKYKACSDAPENSPLKEKLFADEAAFVMKLLFKLKANSVWIQINFSLFVAFN